MKRLVYAIVAGSALAFGCTEAGPSPQEQAALEEKAAEEQAAADKAAAEAEAQEALLTRGQHLVHLGGCNHCHTPWAFDEELKMPVPDMSKMLSGHQADGEKPQGKPHKKDMALIGPSFTSFAMPFGTIYAPNLTPHEAKGMGTWTQEMFTKAMRTGKHMGGEGRTILPPMPWTAMAGLTDGDLEAVFTYLGSIPAIDNAVPDSEVPAPAIAAMTASMDKVMTKMKQSMPPPPAEVPTEPVALGRYLVGAGGCLDCHTPWKFDAKLGMPVPQMDKFLSGHAKKSPGAKGKVGKQDIGLIGPTFTAFKMPFGQVYSANLTSDEKTGIGGWDDATFIASMRKGQHLGKEDERVVLPPMPWMDLVGMSDAELKAILAYLKTVPAVKNKVPKPKVKKPVLAGMKESFDKMLANMAAKPAEEPAAEGEAEAAQDTADADAQETPEAPKETAEADEEDAPKDAAEGDDKDAPEATADED